MDDGQIIELYHRRDEQAIAESERKYGRICRCIAQNILSIKEDAEECVNDTWYAAWKRMPPDKPYYAQPVDQPLAGVPCKETVQWHGNHAVRTG